MLEKQFRCKMGCKKYLKITFHFRLEFQIRAFESGFRGYRDQRISQKKVHYSCSFRWLKVPAKDEIHLSLGNSATSGGRIRAKITGTMRSNPL